MCQKKNCKLEGCLSCDTVCNCNYSCYDCYDICSHASCSGIGTRVYLDSSDIRHKFVCFPCRRVWKSYVSKYIYRELYNYENDISDYVPNICSKNASTEEKHKKRQNYWDLYGSTGWSGNFLEDLEEGSEERTYRPVNRFPRCSKCSQKALSVGRNFRHCKTEKEWNELEKKVKDGKIDLQKDFRDYPREGKIDLFNGDYDKKREQAKKNLQKLIDEEHAKEVSKQLSEIFVSQV